MPMNSKRQHLYILKQQPALHKLHAAGEMFSEMQVVAVTCDLEDAVPPSALHFSICIGMSIS